MDRVVLSNLFSRKAGVVVNPLAKYRGKKISAVAIIANAASASQATPTCTDPPARAATAAAGYCLPAPAWFAWPTARRRPSPAAAPCSTVPRARRLGRFGSRSQPERQRSMAGAGRMAPRLTVGSATVALGVALLVIRAVRSERRQGVGRLGLLLLRWRRLFLANRAVLSIPPPLVESGWLRRKGGALLERTFACATAVLQKHSPVRTGTLPPRPPRRVRPWPPPQTLSA